MQNKQNRTKDRKHIVNRAALMAMLLVFMLGMTTFAAYGDSEEPTESGAPEKVTCSGGVEITPIGDPKADPPKLAANGAALYSLDLDTIVYAKNEDYRIEPYSTTKLLTCWLALENLDLDQVVTASKKATQTYENGTSILLKEGEKMTVRDLIYGALLESGNDAAYALGEAVSGSEKDFAELMNKTVKEWGCEGTSFANANGWKHEEHYTTPHDFAIITAKCLENSELAKMSIQKTYVIPETNMSAQRELKNYFLHIMEGVNGLTGGKTGTWDDDDCAVVASFSEDGLEAVIVLLGDTEEGRPEDVRKLMEFSHVVTPGYLVPAEGVSVETAWVRHGKTTRTELVVDGQAKAYPVENRAKSIKTEAKYDKLEAPVKKGEVVGDFLIYVDDKLIAEHKLLASEDIETGWLPSYLYISNKVTMYILGVFAALVLFILLLRTININRRKRRARKRLRAKYRNRR